MKGINKKINYNVELVKLIAISAVVIYHISVVFQVNLRHESLRLLLSSGGFVGVTAFLFLSGYNIYGYLDAKNPCYSDFIIGRWKKLSPHYYISLIVALLFTSSAVFLSRAGIMNIFLHFTYFHNLFYGYHGAISGVTWTLGVIFQFYLVAPFLKKAIDRFPGLIYIASLAVTLGFKYLLFMWLFPENNANSFYYFIYGGQLYTSIDIFVLGMLASKFHSKDKKTNNPLNYIGAVLGLAILCAYVLFALGYKRPNFPGIYTNNYYSVLTHSGLAVIIFITFIFFNRINICDKLKWTIGKLGASNYAFYIWHLIILNCIASVDNIFKSLFNVNFALGIFATFVFLYLACLLINLMVSLVDMDVVTDKLKNFFKSNLKSVKSAVKAAVIVFCVLSVSICTFSVVKNIKKGNVAENKNAAYSIYENCAPKMKKQNSTYLFIDDLKKAHFNYYNLRYCMAPNSISAANINEYIYKVNDGNPVSFMECVKENNPDYIVVRKSKLLESNGYKIDRKNGSVFTVNKDAQDIKSFLSEVS